jgi:tetratricopeptide (TPR) repeat protein
MKTRVAILLSAALLLAGSAARAADVVKPATGAPMSGSVTGISSLEVTLKQNAVEKKIPVNEIESIRFEEEPTGLNSARTAIATGRYKEALVLLGKIDAAAVTRPAIKQDLDFYKAFCAARLALAGSGKIADAGKVMLAFVRGNAESFHYFEGCEVLGELLVAIGNYDMAQDYFGRVGKAPWPDYKMRAGVSTGRALLARGKGVEAIKAFDEVLALPGTGPTAELQKMNATLGKATSLAETAKAGETARFDEAVKLIEDVIAKADPEEEELHARAYIALGNCQKKAARKMDAILAYLHVDILYPSYPEMHAEALANLAVLWNDVNKPDRALQAREMLKSQYPSSRWAQ